MGTGVGGVAVFAPGAQPLQFELERRGDLLLIGHRGLRLVHPLHVALAVGTAAEVHFMDAPRDRFLRLRCQSKVVDVLAQELRVADDGQVDVAAGAKRDAGKLREGLALRGGALRAQIAHLPVSHQHGLTQRDQRLVAAAAFEVVPESRQPLQLVLRVQQVPALRIRTLGR